MDSPPVPPAAAPALPAAVDAAWQRLERTVRRVVQTTIAASSHEQWFIVLMAGLVGVYAGLAAGLFGNAIAFFNILFFHTGALWHAIAGDAAWRADFASALEKADWNLTFLIVGAVVVAGALGLDRLVTLWAPLGVLGPTARRFRLLAALVAVGIVLYYPLIALRAFDSSFGTHGDLTEMLSHTPWPVVLLVPALGGLGSGFIVTRMTPRHLGHGVTETMEAVIRDGARIPAKLPLWKGIAAAICTGAGGSVGREGPLVQIGAGVGSDIGQRLGFSRANLTVLVGSGVAAGISASFQAPIAGAMFALEIVLGDFGVRTFSPIVLASVMGTVTSRALLGAGAEVERASYTLVSGGEIVPYAVLGVLSGAVAIFYIVAMERAEHTFYGHRGGKLGQWVRRLPLMWRPAVGGLMLGALGIFAPRVMGTGYETMNAAIAGQLAGWTLAGVCIAKVFATTFTLGSGGQGGSFFPATFIGAVGGGAFGAAVHWLVPSYTASQGAYALVGMGAVVAGATQGPLTGIVMLFELTGDYEIILPLMVACILATVLVQLVLGGSLYTRKLREKGIVLRGGRDLAVLRSLSVREAMADKPVTLAEDARFLEVLRVMGASSQPAFPVVSRAGDVVGMLSLTDVRGALAESEALRDVVRACDLASREVVSAFPDEDLEAVVNRIETRDIEALAVVDRAAPRKLLGLVTRRDALAAYEQALRQTGLISGEDDSFKKAGGAP